MSRAFVKEDVDVPERSGRRRSPSGLPPGALNLMTEDGAQRLRERLGERRSQGADAEASAEQVARLEEVLASVTIVPSSVNPAAADFGAVVTLRDASGVVMKHRIVGVDEVSLDPANVSWVSPLGRALLGAVPGQKLRLGAETGNAAWWTVVAVGG